MQIFRKLHHKQLLFMTQSVILENNKHVFRLPKNIT